MASPVIITFSKYDIRYFRDIQGPCIWNLDFVVAREGETEPLAESSYSFFYTRSVSVEIDLEAGNYVVLVSEICNHLGSHVNFRALGKVGSRASSRKGRLTLMLQFYGADTHRPKSYFTRGLDSGWDRRKLAHIMSERAKGQSIAASMYSCFLFHSCFNSDHRLQTEVRPHAPLQSNYL